MKLFGGRVINEAGQTFTFTRRALVLGGAQAGVGLVLAARMAWISIAENERYSLLSESNRVNLTLIPPRRGWIVDRHNQPIAINRTDFRVDLIPDRLTDKVRTLAMLQRLLALPEDEMRRIRQDIDKARGYQPVVVAENLDWDRFAAVSVRLGDLPGVAPARGFSRFYPEGAAVGHLVGYVGTPSAKQYEETRDPLFVTPGFKVGKDGLEKTIEQRLRGKPGAKRVEVTAGGKPVRELSTRPDVSGGTLKLSVDAGLQLHAARRLGDNSGSVVVMDCQTGELLCMASMPCYDPNSFSDGISHDEWDMLSTDDHLPLLNKTLQGLYPPGSTVKPAVALAILAAGIPATDRVVCPGRIRIGGRFFHCHKRGGHGAVDMNRAIAGSCDIYFYQMARRIGINAIAASCRRLGLGEEFVLPVPSQRYGTVPDTAWKKRKYQTDWTVADTVNATIGQGYMLSNPMQLAVMAARIASGTAVQPRLTASRARAAPLDIPAEHLAFVRQAMSDVVNGPSGTAGRSRLPVEGVLLAGKTGTAQVRRITAADRARGGTFGGMGVPWKFRDHALFVAFAPADAPRYAAAVVIEHGIGGSAVAAPIASDVLLWLFDKDKAVAKLETLEQGWGGDIKARMATQTAEYQLAKNPPPPQAPQPEIAAADNVSVRAE